MPDPDDPDPTDPAPPPPAETDPRFPSGRWTGFWLQTHFNGRQQMRLHLNFAAGKVIGEGSDVVGDFSITGEYDLRDGACRFVKSYLGQHRVLYEGRNQDDGMWIWGMWRIGSMDRGGFHIWPWGEEDPTQRRLSECADLPDEAEVDPRDRVLVPSIDQETDRP